MTKRECRTFEETISLGKELAGVLKPGMIIGMSGTLGAGKTALSKGIALGLGISEDVTSPTFTLLSVYEGKIPLYHFDCYRIESDEEMDSIGAEEYLYNEGISLVEWYEKIEEYFPEDIIKINIAIGDLQQRIITIKGVEL